MNRLMAVLGILLITVSAGAVDPDSAKTAGMTEPAITFPEVLRVILVLGFVLFLIFAAIWVMKKYSPGMMRGTQSRAVKVLSTTYLGPKKSLHLIEVLDRILLVGMTENSVNSLAEFTKAEEIDQLKQQKPVKAPGGGFASVLSNFMRKSGGE